MSWSFFNKPYIVNFYSLKFYNNHARERCGFLQNKMKQKVKTCLQSKCFCSLSWCSIKTLTHTGCLNKLNNKGKTKILNSCDKPCVFNY